MKLIDLKKKAKKLGIKGFSKMNKAELEALLKSRTKKIKVKGVKEPPKEEPPKRKRCPKGTRKDKETGKCLDKAKGTAEAVGKVDIAAEVITQRLDYLTAGKVVYDMLKDRTADGANLRADDLTRPQIIAMSVLKLNVFTLNQWIKLENEVSWTDNEINIAEIAGDSQRVYALLSSNEEDELFVSLTLLFKAKDKVITNIISNELISDILDNSSDIYGLLSRILEELIENDTSGEVYNLEDFRWCCDGDEEQIEGWFDMYIGDGSEKYSKMIGYLRGLEEEAGEDEDGDVNFENVKELFDLKALGETVDNNLSIHITYAMLRELDTEEQQNLIEEEGNDPIVLDYDDSTYVDVEVYNETENTNILEEEYIIPIVEAGQWARDYSPYDILTDLTYGYVDGSELVDEINYDDRYTDYYGFSYTEKEVIDDEVYTLASERRRNDIINEMGITEETRANFDRLKAIADGRSGQEVIRKVR